MLMRAMESLFSQLSKPHCLVGMYNIVATFLKKKKKKMADLSCKPVE